MKVTRTIMASAVIAFAAICFIGLPASNASDSKNAVTFTKDVAPILYNNCVSCHRPGEAGPMALITYKQTRPWARSIKEKVATRVMPPWHADPAYGHFTNDRSLNQKDIDTIVAWVDGGAVEGNPKDMPAVPQFSDGWGIGKPDAVFKLPKKNSIPADGVVDYQYFTVPTNFTEDKWIQAAEIRPDSRAVVHHIIVFVRKGSEQKLLVGYAPGEQPAIMSKGFAKKVPAGADLIFQVHYTPNGVAADDQSYVGLVFAKEPPRNELETRPIMNMRFAIPPGDSNYKVESTFTFPEDAEIHSLMPHMHVRGKDFIYKATFPDGSTKVLLSVPKYDFAWQSYYNLKEPVRAPKGTRIDCVAHYDNSTSNKYNPDPKKEVRWGDQTWEEMMIGWITFAFDSKAVKPAADAAIGQK